MDFQIEVRTVTRPERKMRAAATWRAKSQPPQGCQSVGVNAIEPALAMPVMWGVLLGSLVGAKVLFKIRTRLLRKIFAVIILVLGIELIYKRLTGGI